MVQNKHPQVRDQRWLCSKLVYRVIPLSGGHCSIIYSLMDGIYGGLGECITYGVVLALTMTAMVALESASATGFSLPKMWNLWWPWRVHQLLGCPFPGNGIYSGTGEFISYRVVHDLLESAHLWSYP